MTTKHKLSSSSKAAAAVVQLLLVGLCCVLSFEESATEAFKLVHQHHHRHSARPSRDFNISQHSSMQRHSPSFVKKLAHYNSPSSKGWLQPRGTGGEALSIKDLQRKTRVTKRSVFDMPAPFSPYQAQPFMPAPPIGHLYSLEIINDNRIPSKTSKTKSRASTRNLAQKVTKKKEKRKRPPPPPPYELVKPRKSSPPTTKKQPSYDHHKKSKSSSREKVKPRLSKSKEKRKRRKEKKRPVTSLRKMTSRDKSESSKKSGQTSSLNTFFSTMAPNKKPVTVVNHNYKHQVDSKSKRPRHHQGERDDFDQNRPETPRSSKADHDHHGDNHRALSASHSHERQRKNEDEEQEKLVPTRRRLFENMFMPRARQEKPEPEMSPRRDDDDDDDAEPDAPMSSTKNLKSKRPVFATKPYKKSPLKDDDWSRSSSAKERSYKKKSESEIDRLIRESLAAESNNRERMLKAKGKAKDDDDDDEDEDDEDVDLDDEDEDDDDDNDDDDDDLTKKLSGSGTSSDDSKTASSSSGSSSGSTPVPETKEEFKALIIERAKEVSELQKFLDEDLLIKEEINKRLKEANASIETLNKKIKKDKKDISKLKRAIEKAESGGDDSGRQSTKMKMYMSPDELFAIKSKNETLFKLRGEVKDLTERANSLKKIVEQEQAAIQAHKNKIARLDKEIKFQKQTGKSNYASFNMVKEELMELKEQKKQLEIEILKTNKELESIKMMISRNGDLELLKTTQPSPSPVSMATEPVASSPSSPSSPSIISFAKNYQRSKHHHQQQHHQEILEDASAKAQEYISQLPSLSNIIMDYVKSKQQRGSDGGGFKETRTRKTDEEYALDEMEKKYLLGVGDAARDEEEQDEEERRERKKKKHGRGGGGDKIIQLGLRYRAKPLSATVQQQDGGHPASKLAASPSEVDALKLVINEQEKKFEDIEKKAAAELAEIESLEKFIKESEKKIMKLKKSSDADKRKADLLQKEQQLAALTDKSNLSSTATATATSASSEEIKKLRDKYDKDSKAMISLEKEVETKRDKQAQLRVSFVKIKQEQEELKFDIEKKLIELRMLETQVLNDQHFSLTIGDSLKNIMDEFSDNFVASTATAESEDKKSPVTTSASHRQHHHHHHHQAPEVATYTYPPAPNYNQQYGGGETDVMLAQTGASPMFIPASVKAPEFSYSNEALTLIKEHRKLLDEINKQKQEILLEQERLKEEASRPPRPPRPPKMSKKVQQEEEEPTEEPTPAPATSQNQKLASQEQPLPVQYTTGLVPNRQTKQAEPVVQNNNLFQTASEGQKKSQPPHTVQTTSLETPVATTLSPPPPQKPTSTSTTTPSYSYQEPSNSGQHHHQHHYAVHQPTAPPTTTQAPTPAPAPPAPSYSLYEQSNSGHHHQHQQHHAVHRQPSAYQLSTSGTMDAKEIEAKRQVMIKNSEKALKFDYIELARLNYEISFKEEEISSISAKIKESSVKIEAMQKEKKQTAEEIKAKEDKIAAIGKKAEQMSESMELNEQSIELLESELRKSEAKMQEMRAYNLGANDDGDDDDGASGVKSAKKKLKENQKKLKKVKESKKKLSAELKEALAKKAELIEDLASVEKSLKTANEKIDEFKKQIAEYKQKYE